MSVLRVSDAFEDRASKAVFEAGRWLVTAGGSPNPEFGAIIQIWVGIDRTSAASMTGGVFIVAPIEASQTRCYRTIHD
jgi:hypothetical protein